ncbi:hypothetical protein HD553DRAFT_72146 [Filobasidium floriforme]|uniref:uncharacterized protein n=1 Tax=Filobasidium floriforme TaxID=5210 RepID=UPI001E8EDC3A|nr:uncharacterized protein HD553DRAFT_72146 [Filobasidium floriforme]KAH8082369.1 hypothetical protein HD553DRAFT_72146 [Filobasidium floriforme]
MQPPTLNLKPVDRTSSSSKRPARRPVPDARQVDPINNVRPTWEYMASKDGRDRNLIIMLHGVGDTERPFFQLAQKWQLPGTCILSLRGFFQVPLMDFPSYSYLPISMTHYLSPDPPPIPTKEQLKALQEVTLPLLKNILRYLVRDSNPNPNRSGIESESEKGIGIGKDNTPVGCGCGWDPEEIHLFGWGEGGTIGLELGRSLALSSSSPLTSTSTTSSPTTKNQNGNGNGQEKEDKDRDSKRINRLGSVISISGDLYSTPPVGAKDLGGETPVLYFHRPRVKPSSSSPSSNSSNSNADLPSPSPSWLKRTFAHPQTITAKFSPVAAQQDEKGRDIRMPEGREEWEGVMRFWSEVLVRPGMEETSSSMAGEVYEVVR